jgi:CRISP-associated protein Cas1
MTASPPATPAAPDPPPLVPARMLNEYAYCPRLAYLEWVQGEWADNVETLEGKHAHRRVDREATRGEGIHRRSLHLSSERLGLTAVIDLVEGDGERVRPVDYKRGGKPAAAPGGAWEPERVQLCVQGLLLREHGFRCDEGILYFVRSKQRVRVRFSADLMRRTEELAAEMRRRFAEGGMPPPLEDSPKCPKCSLVTICMPEEVNFLRRAKGKVRPLAASDPGTFPLVVQDPRARLRLEGEALVVDGADGGRLRRGFGEVSHVVLMGGAGVTMPALHECCRREIPIAHLSGGGWFYGLTTGLPHKNVELRAAQFATAGDDRRCLLLARSLVAAKVRNARVLLRRNGRPTRKELALLQRFAAQAETAPDLAVLLGIEGTAARLYFGRFASMLNAPGELGAAFQMERRNRRPPSDPLNALLSLAYTLLAKDLAVAALIVGLDPLMGFYHQPRYGKPALALDLMEPFRPLVADSTVLTAINNGEVTADDFVERAGGVLLKSGARRRFLAAYERRLEQQIRHPLFSYRVTYRRVFEIQARLLARFLLGDVPAYPCLVVR